jgi:hypothetical protein
MATPIRIDTVVQPDGTITIRAPGLAAGQRVTVSVETEEEQQSEETREKRHVLDIVAELPGHQLFKTAEEVDAYIREERDSWDR